LPAYRFFDEKFGRRILRIALRISVFCIVYAFATLVIVPPLAALGGRVPMPSAGQNPNLQEWNSLTFWCNRHYVTPDLRQVTEGVVAKLAAKDSNIVVTYLDCNFPFFDGFPLEPHLSHDDGRKIDLSFFYLDAKTKKPTNERPSWLGYGICVEPRAGEEDNPTFCAEQGAWQYNFMKKYIIPQGSKRDFLFDDTRTRDLIRYFIADSRVQTVLIEPHLEKRLGFVNQNKIKKPPCRSVRHDDHIHVALY
jgi:hypothetical protein